MFPFSTFLSLFRKRSGENPGLCIQFHLLIFIICPFCHTETLRDPTSFDQKLEREGENLVRIVMLTCPSHVIACGSIPEEEKEARCAQIHNNNMNMPEYVRCDHALGQRSSNFCEILRMNTKRIQESNVACLL